MSGVLPINLGTQQQQWSEHVKRHVGNGRGHGCRFLGSNFIVLKGYEGLPDDGMCFVFLMATGVLIAELVRSSRIRWFMAISRWS